MGFFKDLLGKSSARAAENLGQRNEGRINTGYAGAETAAAQGFREASGYYRPYAESGGRANALYADSYGVNGAGERQRAFDTYASDPFNAHSNDTTKNMLGEMFRKYHAQGMGNSGTSSLAISRAGLDAQDRRIADWRGGLLGLGNQGYQANNALAGLASQYYGGMADRSLGRSSALNQNDTLATQAASNARMAGANNILSTIGNVAGAAIGGGYAKNRFGGVQNNSGGTVNGYPNNDPGGTYYGGWR